LFLRFTDTYGVEKICFRTTTTTKTKQLVHLCGELFIVLVKKDNPFEENILLQLFIQQKELSIKIDMRNKKNPFLM